MKRTLIALTTFLSTIILPPSAQAQGTAFTYQGTLSVDGAPCNGAYDFQFALVDALTNQVGSIQNATLNVSNGLFMAVVNPGVTFDSSTRFLKISVRTNGAGAYTALSPLQAILPTPTAMYANNANTASSASSATGFSGNLAGNVTGPQNNTTVASVSGLTAATITNGVGQALAATAANAASTIVKRDALGAFNSGSISVSGNLTLSGNLFLPSPTASIFSGGGLLLRSDNLQNFFAGYGAGNASASGSYNVGVGYLALDSITSGYANTAVGWGANGLNNSGYQNVAIGNSALPNNRGGFNNIAIGINAGLFVTNDNSNIHIGSTGVPGDSGIVRIGSAQTDTFLAGTIHTATTHPQQTALKVTGPGGAGTGVYLDFSTYDPGGNAPGARIAFLDNNYSDDIDFETKNMGALGNSIVSRMRILANGNVGIGNTSPGSPLQVVNAICDGNLWLSSSDRNLKEGFKAIAPREVLAKVTSLPITEWKYKTEPDGTRHLGPVAQDFKAAFGLGRGDTTISSIDEGGVSLAAIRGLNEKLEAAVKEKDSQIENLKQRLERLEKLLEETPHSVKPQ